MKRIPNTKNFALRIDKEYFEKLQVYAQNNKISVNTAINWAIDEFLSNGFPPIKNEHDDSNNH